MGKLARVYRRTDSGLKAWREKDPSLSAEHRLVLGLIDGDIHWDEMCKLLRRHADFQRLADLEAAGFVVSVDASPEADLDFTGGFRFTNAA